MIKQTFGITKIPFLQSDLNLLPHQQEVVDILHIQSQHGGFCVITGEAGVGKTTIKKHLESKAHDKDHLLVSFSRTMDTYNKILLQIAESLELETKEKKLESTIIQVVHDSARSNKTLITVIDEAHLLGPEPLRRLRLLFDRFPRRHNLILFGQSELMLRLTMKNYSDIKSRITYSKSLQRLSEEDTMVFIQKETEACRLPKQTFDDAALDLILRNSQGNLRLCANLCYGSLIEACRLGQRNVDHRHVNAVLIQPHWKHHEDLLTGESST